MNTQPEALRLAAHAEANSNFGDMKSIAAELRRLHGVNQELLEALRVAKAGEKLCEKVLKARKAIAKGEQK